MAVLEQARPRECRLRTGFPHRRPVGARRAELARRGARLDSALRNSLAQQRRQAQELQASRERIVAAADAERRRIERDLHDGAQQALIALAVKLRLASDLAERDGAQVRELLEELCREVSDTAQELRNLAHGIYPPLLLQEGLPAALAEAACRSSLPATVRADSVGRYPAGIEAAVYFCCLEAMQNARKHAGERATLCLRVQQQAAALTFDVVDDGAGFASGSRPPGAGFLNMADRLGAFGGTLRVDSAPGAGTRVTGTIPVVPVPASAIS